MDNQKDPSKETPIPTIASFSPVKKQYNSDSAEITTSLSSASSSVAVSPIPQSMDARVFISPEEIPETLAKLTEGSLEEILIVSCSPNFVRKHYSVLKEILTRAKEPSGTTIHLPKLRVLGSKNIRQQLAGELPDRVLFREAPSIYSSFAVYDKKTVLIANFEKWEDNDPSTATVVTDKEIARTLSSIFESLWKESELVQQQEELRKRMQKAVRESHLLQDILTHDIRNYNQVARLAAELLLEEASSSIPSMKLILQSLLQALDGSTLLLERAKKLGRYLSEENPRLEPINLIAVLKSSMHLVKEANPEKIINATLELESDKNEVLVVADEILSEVFTNLFTNSVRYTESNIVQIDVFVKEEKLAGWEDTNPTPFWRVSIIDKGKGIPQEMKEKIFGRYLDGAKGTGLGMSIVHALVVERYDGRITIGDRVAGDHKKGTIIDVYLRQPQ